MIISGFEVASTDLADAPSDEARWVPAVVPGGVHESLLAAGVIKHPFSGEVELDLRWMEDKFWWYRCSFVAPPAAAGERLTLNFAALDGVATVWLNGEEVARHENQYRPLLLDVTSLLLPANDLLVRFTPPFLGLLEPGEAEAATEERYRVSQLLHPGSDRPPVSDAATRLSRVRRRKGAWSWGWDFTARVPSIGIQSAVSLRRDRVATIEGVRVETVAMDPAAAQAAIRVVVDVEQLAPTRLTVSLRISDPAGREIARFDPNCEPRIEALFEVDDVQLWWTHDLGDQPLYSLNVQLIDESGPVASSTTRFGIRIIELDRSEADNGRLFRLQINGVPLFSRGANWVPTSMLIGSITDEKYRAEVAMAKVAEMNMIRIWGGGIYEPDVFYDACDEAGVLVWQDFMFACDDYPSEDPTLTREVELETAYQVRRLRNHPSIAIWAGNNEIQAIHQLAAGSLEPGNWGWSWFHELLPAVMKAEAPTAVYWPGSPFGEDPTEIVNGVRDGDRHAWEVWHGVDVGANDPTTYATRGEAMHFNRYAKDNGRFISEFGIHASPELATLDRWAGPGRLELRNAAFDHRNKDNPKDKGFPLLELETGLPDSLESYVLRSMAVQAEGLKFGIEHYRRRQPTCSGTLVWQLNDAWPGISWSVIDFDLVAKAGYYFTQRAYRPVIATFKRTEDMVELWLTNSGQRVVSTELLVEVNGFDGTAGLSEKVAVTSEAYSSVLVWSSANIPPSNEYAWVSSVDGAIESNRMFFGPIKDLPLATTEVSLTVISVEPGRVEVEIEAPEFAYLAHVPAPHARVCFDANYLDLRPHEPRRIVITGLAADFDPATLRAEHFRTY